VVSLRLVDDHQVLSGSRVDDVGIWRDSETLDHRVPNLRRRLRGARVVHDEDAIGLELRVKRDAQESSFTT